MDGDIDKRSALNSYIKNNRHYREKITNHSLWSGKRGKKRRESNKGKRSTKPALRQEGPN